MTPTPQSYLLLAALLALQACEPSTGSTPDARLDPTIEPTENGMLPLDAGLADGGDADESTRSAGPLPDDCSDVDPDKAALAPSSASSPKWSGIMSISSVLSVRGARLVIEPGTTVLMDADSGVAFGAGVTLIARGTPEKPIRFCAKQAEPGYWQGLRIEADASPDSVLENVVVSNAGNGVAAVALVAPITVTNLRVVDSATDGVQAMGFRAGSSGLSVHRAARYPVVLYSPDAVTTFPLGGSLEGNPDDVIRLRFEEITADTVFSDAGSPYLQERSVKVRGGAEVMFEAGVDYQFAADTELEVGWNSDDAAIQVKGTEAQPVIFEGAVPSMGYWRGLSIGPNVRSSSTIAHARILHGGGGNKPSLEIRSRVTLDDVALQDNQEGVLLSARLNDNSNKLSVTGTDGVPLSVVSSALPSIPKGGAFTGNAEDYVDVVKGLNEVVTIVGSVPALGVPYRLLVPISLDDGSDVEIEPGAEFVVPADGFIEVGWNDSAARFSAIGTRDKPIVFRGEQEYAGFWRGIVFRESASADSKLDHVHLIGAGQASGGALKLERAVAVSNSVFSKSEGYGILKQPSDTTPYEESNVFEAVARGAIGTY
jgi:hypothetical protein